MAGSTPLFVWPFPTGSDRVMDGDNAIEALARAIEQSFSGIRPVGKSSSADLQLTTVNQPLPGIALGPYQPSTVGSEIWVVIFSVFWHATTMGFGDCTADLTVNGVTQVQMQYSPPAVPERITLTQHVLFGVGPGTATTLGISAKCTAAAGVVKARMGSSITLMRFPLIAAGLLRGALGDELEALPAGEVEP